MWVLADLGLKCLGDVSIASTDTIPGIGGLRPRLTRTEHPVIDMTNKALRLLVDRINRGVGTDPRNIGDGTLYRRGFILLQAWFASANQRKLLPSP